MRPDAGTAAVVERVLSAHMGRQVRVLGTEHLGGEWAPVVRMTLDTDDDACGPTVIVKTRRCGGTGWGYDPANLRNEEASLRLLGSLGAAVAPGVIAADGEAGVLVMTDLGAGPTVEQLVYGDDAGAARKALTAMARSTGVMHARTRGKGGAYIALRAPLGPVDPVLDTRQVISLERWDELCSAVVSCGFPRAERATDDVIALAGELQQPGPLLALTHQDLSPNNGVLTGDRVALVDFEGGGFRHLGLDAALLRFPFPQYGRWATVPADVTDEMMQAYCDELSRGWPMAQNDDAFAGLLAVGCAAWALIRTHRLPRVSDEHQRPEAAHRRRTQLLHTIETFIATAEQAGQFVGLVAWFNDLARAMRQRWPEAAVTPRAFPAFA